MCVCVLQSSADVRDDAEKKYQMLLEQKADFILTHINAHNLKKQQLKEEKVKQETLDTEFKAPVGVAPRRNVCVCEGYRRFLGADVDSGARCVACVSGVPLEFSAREIDAICAMTSDCDVTSVATNADKLYEALSS